MSFKVSSCSGIQCFNGATCQSNGTCSCSNGFTGTYCESKWINYKIKHNLFNPFNSRKSML